MLNDIYNKRIIELAGNIPRLGRLPDPQASATVVFVIMALVLLVRPAGLFGKER